MSLFTVVPVRGIYGGARMRKPEKIWGKWWFSCARGCLCVTVRTRNGGRGAWGGYGVSHLFIYTVLSESTEFETGVGVKLWGTLSHIEFYMIGWLPWV